MIKLEIHSADCQRCIVEKNRDKEETLRAENKKRENQAIEESVENIFNIIKKDLEYSTSIANSQCVTIMEHNFSTYKYVYLDNSSYNHIIYKKEVIDIVTELLKTAGYIVEYYEYGKAWQTRSGKHGYYTIKW